MSITLIFLLIVTILSVLLSFCSLILYFMDSKFTTILRKFGAYFAAILLLVASLLAFLPEASEYLGLWLTILIAFVAFVIFYLACYLGDSYYKRGDKLARRRRGQRVALFVVSILQNICSGIIIGASFTISFSAGIVAATVLTAYEIPQKVGDAAALKHDRYPRNKIILSLVAVSLTMPVFAVLAWLILGQAIITGAVVLAAASGIFVCMAIRNINNIAKLLKTD